MKNVLAFWQRRGIAARIGLVFLLLCLVNWTRLAINGEVRPMSSATPLGEHPIDAANTIEEGHVLSNADRAQQVHPGRITMEQYNDLATGMSYQQAVATLGAEGAEMSSNDIGGSHTVMYQWKAGTMANMNAMFQNDKLISKAQFGLE